MSSQIPSSSSEENEQSLPSQSTISRGSRWSPRLKINPGGTPTTQLQDWFTTLQDTDTRNPALVVQTDVEASGSPPFDQTAHPSARTPASGDNSGLSNVIATVGASNMAGGSSIPGYWSSRMEYAQMAEGGSRGVEDIGSTRADEGQSGIRSPMSEPIAISPRPTSEEREESVVVAYAPLQETVGFFSRLAAQNLESLTGQTAGASSKKMEDVQSEPLPRREVVYQHGFPYPGRLRRNSPSYEESDELRRNLDFFDSRPLNPPSIDYSKMPITSPVLPFAERNLRDLDQSSPPQPTVRKLDWGVWTSPVNFPNVPQADLTRSKIIGPERQQRSSSYLAWHRHTSSDQAIDIAKEFRDGGHRREPTISEQTQAANAVTNPPYPLSSRQRQGTSNSDQESFISPEIIHNLNNCECLISLIIEQY